MSKVALYVEGQSEQILLNQLLKTWWNFTGIRIENIQLFQKTKDRIPNYPDNGSQQEGEVFFLIIDVQGVGSLTSAVANRAKGQCKQGYKIFALRDLHADDFKELFLKEKDIHKIANLISDIFFEALNVHKYEGIEEIELHFAIKDIEAWILTFPAALSKWSGKQKSEIEKLLDSCSNLEHIKNPKEILNKMKVYSKSFSTLQSITSHISKDDISTAHQANRNSSFTQFWNKLISFEGMSC